MTTSPHKSGDDYPPLSEGQYLQGVYVRYDLPPDDIVGVLVMDRGGKFLEIAAWDAVLFGHTPNTVDRASVLDLFRFNKAAEYELNPREVELYEVTAEDIDSITSRFKT